MKKLRMFLALGVIALVTLACGFDIGATQDAGSTALPKVITNCDSRSTPLDLNTTQNLNLQVTGDGSFPGNCAHFCLAVPEGSTELQIGISNFAADLDLYVASQSLEKLMDQSTDASEYTSNVTGMDPENLAISNPAGGIWYAQVCSYDGKSGDFTITTSVK